MVKPLTSAADPLLARLKESAIDDGQPWPISLLNEAIRELEEASNFIEGFASSSESGFARQRKAREWLYRVRRL